MSSAPSIAPEAAKPVAPDSTVKPAPQQNQENKQAQEGKQDDKKANEQQK